MFVSDIGLILDQFMVFLKNFSTLGLGRSRLFMSRLLRSAIAFTPSLHTNYHIIVKSLDEKIILNNIYKCTDQIDNIIKLDSSYSKHSLVITYKDNVCKKMIFYNKYQEILRMRNCVGRHNAIFYWYSVC